MVRLTMKGNALIDIPCGYVLTLKGMVATNDANRITRTTGQGTAANDAAERGRYSVTRRTKARQRVWHSNGNNAGGT